MTELKLFIKSSWMCLLTSLMNSGLSTKKANGVACTSSELNVLSETSLTLSILSVVFRIK